MGFPIFTTSNLEVTPVLIDDQNPSYGRWASGDSERFPIYPFQEHERVDLLNEKNPSHISEHKYRLRAVEKFQNIGPRDVLEILPIPKENLFVTVVYTPQLQIVPENGDFYYQGVSGVGEEWIVLDALIALRGKTDEQTALWERRKAEIEMDLFAHATERDSSQPDKIGITWHKNNSFFGPDWRTNRWRTRLYRLGRGRIFLPLEISKTLEQQGRETWKLPRCFLLR